MTAPLIGDGFDQPTAVSPLQQAFPANVSSLMPDWDDIPENFRHWSGDAESKPWIDFQSTWFYKGISKSAITPRADVDVDTALGHLATIQGSFEPKHEHKVAAVAWLASRWFSAVAS